MEITDWHFPTKNIWIQEFSKTLAPWGSQLIFWVVLIGQSGWWWMPRALRGYLFQSRAEFRDPKGSIEFLRFINVDILWWIMLFFIFPYSEYLKNGKFCGYGFVKDLIKLLPEEWEKTRGSIFWLTLYLEYGTWYY